MRFAHDTLKIFAPSFHRTQHLFAFGDPTGRHVVVFQQLIGHLLIFGDKRLLFHAQWLALSGEVVKVAAAHRFFNALADNIRPLVHLGDWIARFINRLWWVAVFRGLFTRQSQPLFFGQARVYLGWFGGWSKDQPGRWLFILAHANSNSPKDSTLSWSLSRDESIAK